MSTEKKTTNEKPAKVRHEVVISMPAVKVPKILLPIQGFVDFVRQQGVIGLAVGLVLGTQIKTLVDSIVTGFINPTVALVLPGSGNLNLKAATVSVNGKTAIYLWGPIIAQIISFLAVAGVLYFIIHALKLDRLDKKK